MWSAVLPYLNLVRALRREINNKGENGYKFYKAVMAKVTW